MVKIMNYHLLLPDKSYKYIAPVHRLPVMLPEITATDILSISLYAKGKVSSGNIGKFHAIS